MRLVNYRPEAYVTYVTYVTSGARALRQLELKQNFFIVKVLKSIMIKQERKCIFGSQCQKTQPRYTKKDTTNK